MGHPDYVYTPRSKESCERQRQSMLKALGIPPGFRRVYGHHVPEGRAPALRERAAKLARLRGFQFASNFVAMVMRGKSDRRNTMAEFDCPQCGKPTRKPLGHINHSAKLGRNVYCGKECAAAGRRTRTPEAGAEYMRLYREAHREEARRRAREWRAGKGRERVLASQRASYLRNREENLLRMKEYREKNYPKIKAGIQRWLEAHPEKKDLYAAKVNIAGQYGIRVRDIPDDLAWALVEQWRIRRAIKEAQGTEARRAETVQHGSVHDGPVAKPCAQKRSGD